MTESKKDVGPTYAMDSQLVGSLATRIPMPKATTKPMASADQTSAQAGQGVVLLG